MKHLLLTTVALAVVAFASVNGIVSADGKVKTIELKGYITQVHSPSSFEIDDYKMSLDGKYDVELQNVEGKAIKFDPATHIRVGTLVKMKCKVNTETLEGRVEDIKIDAKQFRKLSHTAVLDSNPTNLVQGPDGKWSGELLVDARRISITSDTKVAFKLNKSEEREAKEKKRQQDESERLKKEEEEKARKATQKQAEEQKDDLENKSDDGDFDEEESVEELRIGAMPLQSLTDIGPGVYVTYKGTENLDGTLVASDLIFVKNDKTKQERELWQDARIKEKESRKANSFDQLKIGGKKYKALQEDVIQEYVDKLGRSLVPRYQENLLEDDENKIPFRFVVVYAEDINASAYPTGMVVVHHDVFNYIENEAQLAFLLSHEIAHATQEHTIRQINNKKKTRAWLRVGAIASYAMGYGLLASTLAATEQAMRAGYSRSVENQADRVGMASMIVNGYDPREAPRLWKISSMNFGDRKAEFFWSATHSSNTERRSYLMLTLRNTYANLNYGELKKDSLEFQKIKALIREKYPNKRMKKNQAKGILP